MSTGARCDYNNDASNVAAYGRLYNWYAATNARGAVPKWLACSYGWRVDGIGGLHHSQGFNGTEGTALKSTSGWSSGGNGTDDFGFSALPGGYRTHDRWRLLFAGSFGYWWSSSPSGGNAWARYLDSYDPGIDRSYDHPRDGFSVRCLRDAD